MDRVHSDYVKDGSGRPAGPYLTRRLRDNGPGTPLNVEAQLAWAGSLLVAERDRHGVHTRFTHTPGGRVATRVTETAPAGSIAADLREHYTYDAAGNLLSTRRQASAAPDNTHDVVSSSTYDLAGRLLTSTVPGPLGALTTTYNHFYGGNKLVTRVVQPNGADRITTTFLDGRLKTLTGAAVVAEAYGYTVAANGQLTTRRDLGTAGSGIGWSSGVADWLGRTVIANKPTTASTTVTLQLRSFYNNSGQIWKQQTFNSSGTALLAPVLTTYDAMGARVASGLDLNENGALVAASTDRYSTFASGFLSAEGHWWAAAVSWDHHTDNSAATRRSSKVLSRLTGCTCNLAETRSYDVYDQATIVRRNVNRALGEMSEVAELPGVTTTATTTHRYGFKVSTSSPSNLTTAYVYDAYGRQILADGRDAQVAETTYYPGTSFPKLQRGPTPSAPAALQTFTELVYDSAGQLAERRVKHDAGTASTWFAYNPRGQVLRQWGSAENPVEYAYDSYGRLTDQWTYRSSTAFETATWPTGQSGDRTQFAYHNATSLLTTRTDAALKATSYLYDALNRLSRRTLARGNYATYTYRDAAGSRTGELWKTEYKLSGGAVDTATPTVEHASTRDGLPASVIDVTGTRTFEYDSTSRVLTAEVLPAYFGTSRRLTYRYNGTLPGRLAGWRFHDSTDHLDIGYTYEAATGRLDTLSSTARVGSMVYGAHSFDYAYKSDTDLVSSVTQGSFVREQTWKTWGDVAEVWTSKYGPSGSATTLAAFAYGYDDTARRTSEDLIGSLAVSLGYTANGLREGFTPDARSQLTALRRHELNASGQTTTEVLAQKRDWTYDALGNRTLETRSAGSINYAVNNLNQYSSLTGLFTATITHDFDGNRTSDATWNYTFDGENRLITMVKKDNTQRLEFAYDYLHRRVAKTVRSGPLATSPITSQLRFVYQGYQIIAEINATSPFAVVRSYTWGLDLTGTVGGGGGVGGLLQIHDATSRYQPLYNANGNVRGLIAADAFGAFSAGAIVAAYDYNVFGEATATLGTAAIAAANPIRFASKYLDVETGLYDHNHRFYDPVQGRFINRDPIGEKGGLNLYAYTMNRPSEKWDLLGFDAEQCGEMCQRFWSDMREVYERYPMLSQALTGRYSHRMWGDAAELVAFSARNRLAERIEENIKAAYPGVSDVSIRFNSDGTVSVSLSAVRSVSSTSAGQMVANAYILNSPSSADIAAAISVNVARSLPIHYEGDVSGRAVFLAEFAIGTVITAGGEYGQRVEFAIATGGLTIGFKIGGTTAAGDSFIQLDPSAPAFVGDIMYSQYGLPRSEVDTGPYGGAVVLGHELSHALFNFDDPYSGSRTSDGGPVTWEETGVSFSRNALFYENQVRSGLGLPLRTTYHGMPGFP